MVTATIFGSFVVFTLYNITLVYTVSILMQTNQIYMDSLHLQKKFVMKKICEKCALTIIYYLQYCLLLIFSLPHCLQLGMPILFLHGISVTGMLNLKKKMQINCDF